ncbi:MAG: hypothetical protein AAF840_18060, partial [Bacteroidota bacterium]
MKTLLTLLLVVAGLFVAPLNGQTAPEPYPDCTTSSFRLSEQFMAAYERADFTAAREILDTWTEVCGLQEVTNRAILLIKLSSNDVLDAGFLTFQYPMLKQYLGRRQLQESGNTYDYEYDRASYGFIPIGRTYDTFMAKAFRELRYLEDQEFRFLRDIYANEPTVKFSDLARPQYRATVLGQLYNQEDEAARNRPKPHYSIFAGAWIPLNEDNFVGTHPEVGFSVGLKHRRWNYDFVVAFRFLRAANTYFASRDRNGPREATDKFFGGVLGAAVGYDLLQTEKTEVQLSLQVGADGWDMLEENDDQEASSLFRFTVSPGLQYRVKLDEQNYLGLYTRYHHVSYQDSGLIDF